MGAQERRNRDLYLYQFKSNAYDQSPKSKVVVMARTARQLKATRKTDVFDRVHATLQPAIFVGRSVSDA